MIYTTQILRYFINYHFSIIMHTYQAHGFYQAMKRILIEMKKFNIYILV